LRIKVVEDHDILGSAFFKKALEKVALVALSDSDYDALVFISIACPSSCIDRMNAKAHGVELHPVSAVF